MYLSRCFSTLALIGPSLAKYSLQTIYQFDNSFSGAGYTDIENVALRSSNGNLVLSMVTDALIVELNPDGPVPEILANISAAYDGAPTSATGIVETAPDVFTIAAGKFQTGPDVPGGIVGLAGSWSVWSLDLRESQAKLNKIVDMPEAEALNSVTILPGDPDYVLISDSGLSVIWKVNTKTGAYLPVLSDPLFGSGPYFSLTLNGIKARGSYLYFANTAQSLYGSIQINTRGTAVNPATPVVSAANGTLFDDFTLDWQGNAWMATLPNMVTKITRDSSVPVVVAGGGDDDTLVNPTATIFRGCKLFITTGGMRGTVPKSGGVFAIDLCECAGSGGN